MDMESAIIALAAALAIAISTISRLWARAKWALLLWKVLLVSLRLPATFVQL